MNCNPAGASAAAISASVSDTWATYPGCQPSCERFAAIVASLPLFLIGGGVAGAGIGILFRAALGTVAAVADAERRGEALAGIFLIAYAGMTIPPLLTAGALKVWPAVTVLVGLVTLAAILVAISGSRMLRR